MLEFSESVSTAETLADQAFTLPGTGNFDATNSTITAGPGSNKITLLLGTGATAIDEATSTINTIAGTISDGTNTNPAQSAIPFNDINAPVVLEVLSEDRNTDGHTDTFAIIFDEQVTISTGSISIVGATINSLSLETNNKTNDTLTLDINFTESSDQFRTDITNKIINIGV
ncbi:MAG: hypothetical protein U9Q15_04985 [Patescibacteria group bacterium]|nr:hypothetical protein [Patescibacteria group bacterium]